MVSVLKLILGGLYLVILLHTNVLKAEEVKINQLPDCNKEGESPGRILVSTLDGNVAALSTNGKLLWQLETGPLLLSNIHRLELTNNGQWIRIIPSLSGSLYKFDGSYIDAIPLTADNLLTSSFKYSDDMVIAGGREVRNYAVDMDSGDKLYECSIDGCKNNTDIENVENFVIIEKNSYVVRAIEPRTGIERWNFSIATHNIKVPFASCIHVDTKLLDYTIRAVLPNGQIMVNSETTLHNPWDYKFESPIVGIWKWDGRDLHQVDLFEIPSEPSNPTVPPPDIYVGMHNKQLYVFESERMKENLQLKRYPASAVIDSKGITRIPWKPISATNVALVPIDDSDGSTALSVLYSSEYVNGNGFYFYTPKEFTDDPLICNNQTVSEVKVDNNNTKENIMSTFLIWFLWWIEMTIIFTLSVLFVNIACNKLDISIYSRIPTFLKYSKSGNKNGGDTGQNALLPLHGRTVSESLNNDFVSRYLSEFETISCLGRGGFGVVFHVMKKFDDCHYAVKRINLPREAEDRERVMREVKALAKLDHRHIVRYYNAWIETPPLEWQKEQDKKLFSDAPSILFSNKWTKSHQKSMSFSIDMINLQRQRRMEQMSLTNSSTESEDDKEITFSFSEELQSPKANFSDSFIVFDSGTGSSSTKKEFSGEQKDCTSNGSCFTRESTLSSHIQRKTNWRKHGRRHHSLDITSQGKVVASEPPPTFLYIQMQLCQEESLRDWLKNNRKRDRTFLLHVFQQILEAVEYVHLHGLIHRDLKPSNVFFSLEGQVKIGDFGLVTAMQDVPTFGATNFVPSFLNNGYTKAVGTKLYMSPEQFKGEKYNYKVDIYSLGVILFELLIPFSTEMERVKTLTNLRKKAFPEDFPKEYERERALLGIMLADNPKDRPTTFGIRARPPFLQEDAISKPELHFELPKTKESD